MVLNPLPDCAYLEELLGMEPVMIGGDLTKIPVDPMDDPIQRKKIEDYRQFCCGMVAMGQ